MKRAIRDEFTSDINIFPLLFVVLFTVCTSRPHRSWSEGVKPKVKEDGKRKSVNSHPSLLYSLGNHKGKTLYSVIKKKIFCWMGGLRTLSNREVKRPDMRSIETRFKCPVVGTKFGTGQHPCYYRWLDSVGWSSDHCGGPREPISSKESSTDPEVSNPSDTPEM